jgi:cytochrome c-type biogenesis protein CcmH
MISRREWVRGALLGGAATLVSRASAAQQGIPDTSNLFAMDQSAARSVRLPPKPGAMPSMTPTERDDLEHRIRCQCGCTLDVFTCRTTDFSCQVSPAMHRDVMALVAGGYTGPEILDQFVNVYGLSALMAPPKEGFNLVGYLVPGVAIAIVAVLIALTLRRWKKSAVPAETWGPTVVPPGATDEEMKRLEAAVRDDA